MTWWKKVFTPLFGLFRRHHSTSTAAQINDQELVLSLSAKRIPSWRQFRYLPRLLGPTEMRLARMFVTVAVVSSVFIIGHYCSRHLHWIPADGGTLTEGLIGTPQYLNPILARPFTPDTDLTNLLFRGLIKVDRHLNVVPDLAESLSVSADGKTYTAVLRKSQLWSDGTAITAADVVYTFETIADANYQSPYQAVYANVKIASTDTRTIVFTLPAATPAFRSTLTLGILPSSYWQDQTPQTFSLAELNVKPISSGPMKFQSVTKDRSGLIRSFTFVRNKVYGGRASHIDKLNIKLYGDTSTAVDALHSDEIDSLGGVELKSLPIVSKDRVVRADLVTQLTGVFFNEKTSVVLKIPEVRKALSLATNRPALLSGSMKQFGQPVFGPLVPGLSGFSADAKKVGFDITAAGALLDQAGWKAGADGMRAKKDQALAFTLTTVDNPTYATLAQELAKQWAVVGVKVTVNTTPLDAIQKNVIKARQYEALLFGQILDVGGDITPLWHSSQQQGTGIALAVVYNKNADANLDKARSATDETVRANALADFQNIIVDQAPAILLTQNTYLYAHERNLRGFTYDRFHSSDDHFDGIENWYLKTKLSWK